MPTTTVCVRTAPDNAALETAEVELPDGWYRVLSGAVRPGDRHLHASLFLDCRAVEWVELDGSTKHSEPYDGAETFFCLIRRGEPVEEVCPRCYQAARPLGWKYCRSCAYQLVLEMRKSES